MSEAVESQADRWERVAAPHYKKGFDGIPNKRSQRADLHALTALDAWLPGRRSGIVTAAEHDEICLNVDDCDLEDRTDDQLIELARCGLRYGAGCLCLLV